MFQHNHWGLRFFWLCLGILLTSCAGTHASRKPAGAFAGLNWRQGADFVELLARDRVVWRLNLRRDRGKPYFDPVALAGSASLTWAEPPDHPWHYGLWHSWKYINGVNYWEGSKQTPHQPEGVTSWHDESFDLRPDYSARLTLCLDYACARARPRGATAPRSERASSNRGLRAGRRRLLHDGLDNDDESRGGRFDLRPRPPLGEPHGVAYGGYAGLSLRLNRTLSAVEVAATDDPGEARRFDALAAELNGELEGRSVGIAILDHPANPNHPVAWYATNNPAIPFYYLNAAFLLRAPYRLAARQTLTLRYRVAIHPGRWDAKRLTLEEKNYAADK